MSELINPPSLPSPVGFAYAVKCRGTLLFLGGAVGARGSGAVTGETGIVEQFELALTNIHEVVTHAGGSMRDIVKLTYFVVDRDAYVANLKPIGDVYRRFFGKYYPAQSLFGVTALFDPNALIEVEAIACLAGEG